MVSAFATLLTGALILVVVYLVRKYTYWKRRGIPTADGYIPFVGHILPVLTIQTTFAELHRKIYNDHKKHSMVGYYKLWTPVLIVREPQLVKTVMQTNFSSFHETGLAVRPDLDPLLSRNPFFNKNEQWSRARKRITTAFSNARLKQLFVAVSGVCDKFEQFLNERLATSKRYEVELKQLFSRFTGEVVANAGLGIQGFCFEDDNKSSVTNLLFDALFVPTFTTAFRNHSMFVPELMSILRYNFVPKELDKFFRSVVRQALDMREAESTVRNDFLQFMIEVYRTTSDTFDEEGIVAEVMSFYVDGLESSSITLSFVGYYLAKHQDVQDKLRAEVVSTIAKHDGVLTYESLKEMTYMEQVISESQRFYPALASFSKRCTEKFELQGSDGLTCYVEPGTEIIIPNQALQLDPEYWPDPEVFDPERFNEERKQSITKMTFLPFGEGPRMCVGMKMGMMQMKSCLATLVSKYRLELSSKTQLPLKMSPYHFLTSPVGGLWAHISKI